MDEPENVDPTVHYTVSDVTGIWSAIASTMAVLGHANIGFVGAAVAVDTVSLVLMSFRWRLLLRSLGSGASLWDALLAYSAGVCVCNITPTRTLGGDACRAALIRRPGGIPPVKAIAASVVYDRMTDVPGLLMLGVLAAPVLKPALPRWTILALLALAAAVAAPPLYRRFGPRIAQWHPTLIGRSMGVSLVAAVGCSLLIWLLDITRLMLVGRAFGVRFVPGQAAAVSLLRLGSGLVPVPAGIGVVDGALVAAFIWLGLPASSAAALAIVERAIVYGWGTALGAVALLLRGGSGALRKARSEATRDRERQ
ncbi:MAG TPA: lysylphosphatidylglycerol synthase transmembrane domain-containing protein [Vicinamibacterales bacterium]|nr:lysylphosphatidylglycerol synthase transmembrane domain-containing protein [Vicinamibacterales bacterium]